MADLDLRPLTLGETLDRTFSLYRKHFLLFIGIAVIPQLLILAVHLGEVFLAFGPARTKAEGPVIALGLLNVVGFVIYLAAYLIVQGGTVFAVSDIYLGRATTIGESLRRMRGEIANLFGVSLLNGTATLLAAILLIIPGIYLACRLITCIPAALLENLGARESLERSFSLTKDNAGRSFVIYLLYFVLLYGAMMLFTFPFLFAMALSSKDPAILRVWMASMQVGNSVAMLLITPILMIATTVFYYDLRVRKEAFDLQLMMNPSGNIAAPAQTMFS